MTEGKLYYFGLGSTEINITPFIPAVVPGPKSREDQMFMYNGKVAVDRRKKKIVVCNNYFNQLEIYDYDGKLLKEIRVGKLESPFSTKPSNRKFYFTSICISEKYIYAAFIGKNPNLSIENLFASKSELFVFSWEGEPLAKITLDRPVGVISINTKKGTILSIDDFKMKTKGFWSFKFRRVCFNWIKLFSSRLIQGIGLVLMHETLATYNVGSAHWQKRSIACVIALFFYAFPFFVPESAYIWNESSRCVVP